jgi:hypothetical protein
MESGSEVVLLKEMEGETKIARYAQDLEVPTQTTNTVCAKP